MPPRIPQATNALRVQSKASSQSCPFARSFTSTSVQYKSPLNQKKGVAVTAKKGGNLRLKKKARVRDSRPPEPGERKAIRKRIVISNTNALEVAGLGELNPTTMRRYTEMYGQVMSLPAAVQDQLRTVEAFKVGQGWGFFRTPACLFRQEAVQVAAWMDLIQGRRSSDLDTIASSSSAKVNVKQGGHVRRLVIGERKAGKSVLLLQAMSHAFLREWIVINIPEARELANAQTEYAPVPKSDPQQFLHPDYTAKLLAQIQKANAKVFDKIKLNKTELSSLPIPTKANMTLSDLCIAGSREPEVAWDIFRAMWNEITATGRPPILFCTDNVSHLLAPTKFQTVDEAGKLHAIHPFDFVLIKQIIDLLSGVESLPNGGIVLAATSESEHAKSDPLRVAIAMAKARQQGGKAPSNAAALPAPEEETPEKGSSTLVSSSEPKKQELSAFWNPYHKLDMRALSPMTAVDTMELKGFTKDEAQAIIEYWASSGMVRRRVDSNLVNEKWTLSGGGVIGEMEKAVVKARF